MPSRNKEKYGSFGNYVMQDKEVFKWLFLGSQIVPPILFGFVLFTLVAYSQWEVAIIVSIFMILFLMRLYKFLKNGGMKNMPEMNAEQFVWGK